MLRWDLAELWLWMRSSQVATVLGSIPASNTVEPTWGAADEAVLNNVHKKKTIPLWLIIMQVLEQEKYQLRRQLEVAEEEYQLRFLFMI